MLQLIKVEKKSNDMNLCQLLETTRVTTLKKQLPILATLIVWQVIMQNTKSYAKEVYKLF